LQRAALCQRFSGRDAGEHFVCGLVLASQEVHVVRADKPHAQLSGQLDQERVDLGLVREALVLHLYEESLGPEDVQVLPGDLARPPGLVAQQRRRHLAPDARRHADQTLIKLRHEGAIDPRAVVETLQVRSAGQLQQVAPTRLVHDQQDDVIRGRLYVAHRPVVPSRRRYVRLYPEDRPDARLPGGRVELDRAEKVAVVRQGQRLGPMGLAGRYQILGPGGAVQKGVMGVYVQVNESIHDRVRACVCLVSLPFLPANLAGRTGPL